MISIPGYLEQDIQNYFYTFGVLTGALLDSGQ